MIHDEHPFADAEDDRDPTRRFRGRLAAPVTVVTATGGQGPVGLTVSSLVVAEGDPPRLFFLCTISADLAGAIFESGAFVVHVLEEGHRSIADVFAGVRPSPGGPFAGLDAVETDHGPVIPALRTRAMCRLAGHTDVGVYALMEGVIEHVELHDLAHPLQYFRGSYLRS